METGDLEVGFKGIVNGVIDNAISVSFNDLMPTAHYSMQRYSCSMKHDLETGDHVRISHHGVANFGELKQLLDGSVVVNLVNITKIKSAHKPSPLDYC